MQMVCQCIRSLVLFRNMVFQRTTCLLNKSIAVKLTSRCKFSNLLPVHTGGVRWFSNKTKAADAENPKIAIDRSDLLKDNDITVTEMKERGCLYMGLDRGFKPLQRPRAHLLQLLPESQDELPERKMCDSFSTAIIPLRDDKRLQERYVNISGSVRLGRVLEEMDAFAVWVAYKHILNPKQKSEDPTPYVMVTILVDKISFTSFQPKYDVNIRLSGHVSWVGKSSIEVMVWAEQLVYGEWQNITRAVFLMAARNSTNDGPAVVNKLVPETDSEKKIHLGGESRKKKRLQLQKSSLLRVVPDEVEQKVIHELFLKTVDVKDPTIHKRELPAGCMWMDEHIYSSILFGHPEDRNMNDTMFGGFMIRNSLELAWMSASLYCKYRPKLLHVSDINFRKPIKVGAFINMHAHVVYTELNHMQIAVFADVLDPVASETFTTNTFQFTFENPVEVFRILPRSYSDAMLYIDGRRHFQYVMGLKPKTW